MDKSEIIRIWEESKVYVDCVYPGCNSKMDYKTTSVHFFGDLPYCSSCWVKKWETEN